MLYLTYRVYKIHNRGIVYIKEVLVMSTFNYLSNEDLKSVIGGAIVQHAPNYELTVVTLTTLGGPPSKTLLDIKFYSPITLKTFSDNLNGDNISLTTIKGPPVF